MRWNACSMSHLDEISSKSATLGEDSRDYALLQKCHCSEKAPNEAHLDPGLNGLGSPFGFETIREVLAAESASLLGWPLKRGERAGNARAVSFNHLILQNLQN